MKWIKRTAWFLLLSLGLFTIYANMESRPMHAKVQEVDWLIVDVQTEVDPASKKMLEQKYAALEGMSSVVLNPEQNRMCFSFNNEKLSKLKLMEKLVQDQLNPKIPEFGEVKTNGPQCPIPMDWILKFEKIKFAFNFR